MKAITLAFDHSGKATLLHGPEVRPAEQKATRIAARQDGLPKGIARLETYNIGGSNRAGVVGAQQSVTRINPALLPPPTAPAEAPTDSLADKKVDELREIATSLGIAAAGLKKAELIEAIEARQAQ